MAILQADQRIVDFCGENIKPGLVITTKTNSKDSSILFSFKITGTGGSLKAKLLADTAKHAALLSLNEELDEHERRKREEKEAYEKEGEEFEATWPIDLSEYCIPSKESIKAAALPEGDPLRRSGEIVAEELVWRVRSLKAVVDDDTKILVRPLPESKKAKKMLEARYAFRTYADMV